jgi:hypothetical protein
VNGEPANLFGTPGAEILYDDPASVYEHDIEPWWDPDEDSPRQIEEHTSRFAVDGLPSVDDVASWLAETYAEADMAPDDDGKTADRIADHQGVKVAAHALFEAARAVITYRWAENLVATHTITVDADGQPLCDGEPLYTEARPQPHACSRCGSRQWTKGEHVGPARRCMQCGHISPEPEAA